MSTAPSLTRLHLPPLYSGDRMTQAEFDRRASIVQQGYPCAVSTMV
jgi:hypothetical protein